uniref:Thrombopoietin receptor n=1 Tax=Geotrypetes seraphini TaxID=260995 RepID=A0A6P8NLG5_GEOSA|nr:thrombopoietin receptor [Geotrypetes seraphini]
MDRFILVWLTFHVASAHLSPVTEEDISLLSEVSENVICFSRTFKDLICFWDEEEEEGVEGNYIFFYRFEGLAEKKCSLTLERIPDDGTRYICVFPSTDVWMFANLFIKVVDTVTNRTKFSQELQVDAVGLSDPPMNVTAFWMQEEDHIHISWKAPFHEYNEFLIYQILYFPEGSKDAQNRIDVGDTTVYDLRNLKPGVQYHIRVRSKPNDVSLSGFWGPWSETVTIVTPLSSDEISLCCFTSDLLWVICEWKWDTENPDVSHALFYKQIDLVWQRCGARNKSHNGSSLHNWKKNQDESLHHCAFRPEHDSKIYVIVNITTALHLVFTYVKEPFILQHIVLTEPPKVQKVEVSGSSLHLEWEPPLLELSEHMIYQIRYTEENGTEWKADLAYNLDMAWRTRSAKSTIKPSIPIAMGIQEATKDCMRKEEDLGRWTETLQIQHRANSEILDLRMGTTYSLQIRTKPNGEKFQGFWSIWTDNIQVTVPASTGWIPFLVGGNFVAFTGILVLMRCAFPSMYSNLKKKVWPPVPNLHQALDGFLAEMRQQCQINPSIYEKPVEDMTFPCLLEIISERQHQGSEYSPETGTAKELLSDPAALEKKHLHPTTENMPEQETGNPTSAQEDCVKLDHRSSSKSCSEIDYYDRLSQGPRDPKLGLAAFLDPISGSSLEPENEGGHYTSLTLLCALLGGSYAGWNAPGAELGEGEDCDPQPLSATHISNQSYLLLTSCVCADHSLHEKQDAGV